jgi:hypothetical protein
MSGTAENMATGTAENTVIKTAEVMKIISCLFLVKAMTNPAPMAE